jgi:hypothetical protein
VFRQIAKPVRGDYRSANKQFIAPLPVPDATLQDRTAVAAMARVLQIQWSKRRELIVAISERLSVLPRARHREDWLWPDLPSIADLEERAPHALKLAPERHDWADARRREAITVKLEALQARLDAADKLEAVFHDGELALFADGAPLIDHIYLDDAAGKLTEAYWHWLLLSQKWRDAQSFSTELRHVPTGAEAPAAAQFIAKVEDLAADVAAIVDGERELNDFLFELYGLTDDEKLLVKSQHNGRLKLTNR